MIRILLALAILSAPVAAQSIRDPDSIRLGEFDAALGRVLKGAFAEGAPADTAILTEVLAGPAGPIAPEGDWNCRTLKLGRILPLTVYGDFRCRITADGPNRWRLEKLTGSQRTAGTILREEEVAVYLGVGYVDGGPAVDYAGLPAGDQTPVEPGQTHAQIGIFEQMDPNRARLLLPAPILESAFDILYLTR